MDDPAARVSDRIKASELLAERGWGKAAAFVPTADEGSQGMTQEERDRIVEEFDETVRRLASANAARDSLGLSE